MSPERGPLSGSNGREHARAAASRGVLQDVLRNPLYWLLVATPALLFFHHSRPDAHTALFLFSIIAIVPLAALLSQATESVAARTGDAVGGLLNATLGNLTELVIASPRCAPGCSTSSRPRSPARS
jgi:Ca2+:H+ antiporter